MARAGHLLEAARALAPVLDQSRAPKRGTARTKPSRRAAWRCASAQPSERPQSTTSLALTESRVSASIAAATVPVSVRGVDASLP